MLLLSPGPGICDFEVLEVMAQPCIHHRSESFKQIYQDIVRGIKKLIGTEQGEVIVMNGSGSYGMEGAIHNLLKKEDSVLSIRCGYFSNRMFQMARLRGCHMYSLHYPDYETYQIEDVEFMLSHNHIKALLVTHCESETGSLQDLWKLGELCFKYNVLLIVDSISGAVMNEIRMDDMHIDCLLMASQKGLLMPPGLCISILSQRAINTMHDISTDSYIFDYKTILSKFYQDAKIHTTPCVPLYRGLQIALQKLNQVSGKQLANYYYELHQYVKLELKNMNIQILSEGHESNSIIVGKLPYGKRASHIQKALETRGIRIELGLQDKEDKIIRVGIMNAVQKKDLEHFVFHMKELLYET